MVAFPKDASVGCDSTRPHRGCSTTVVEVKSYLRCPAEGATADAVAVVYVLAMMRRRMAAKPILDIDVIVEALHIKSAIEALESVGYVHRGDLGIAGREAFDAPDDRPRRHVYVCAAGTLNLRNHLAVRDVLQRRDDLRAAYAAVKLTLAADPTMDIDTYMARKSAVLQRVLAESDLTPDEREQILRLNDPHA